jgi:transcriptional regulator with XRE-family HTH domain
MMIGETIKLMRLESGISQTELAREAGIAQNSLSEIERNKRQPKFEAVCKIAELCEFEIIFIDKNSNLAYGIDGTLIEDIDIIRK